MKVHYAMEKMPVEPTAKLFIGLEGAIHAIVFSFPFLRSRYSHF
ncbi:MAG: hypothetical protein ACFFD4_21260 [Candidatus Odinarchaeota archaeon]